jgi:enterochelin esterase-like enzyme
MLVKAARSLVCVAALVAGFATELDGQGRGAPPPVAQNRTGKIERVTVHGKALEGNLEGDSPDRDALVYLPPSYLTDQTRRFPVVYLLHGYDVRDIYAPLLASLQDSGDRLAAAPGFSEAIVVTPDAFTLHKGSMYSNSPTTGDWERFIAEDLVAYMDSHYRTLASRTSRGLAGHSMGGYGALRIGMKRPDVFMSLYVMSACCLAPIRDPRTFDIAAGEAIKTREQAEAAAWSPNPANPPLYLDLPVRDGKVRPDIVAKWVANAPIEMLEQYASNLRKYYAVAIDIGTSDDTLIASNRQLHDGLTRLRVPHAYEEYDGDHTNRIRERIESRVLPFFSKNLVAPANPTSPQVP